MTDGRLATMSAVTHRYGDVVALDGLNLGDPGRRSAGRPRTEWRREDHRDRSPARDSAACRRVRCGCSGTNRAPVRSGCAVARCCRSRVFPTRSPSPSTWSCSPATTPLPCRFPDCWPMAGLEDLADRRYGRLSGGQKQRVMFALALAGDPELVFPGRADDGARRRGAPEPVERNPRTEGGRPHRGPHHALPGGGGRARRSDRGHPRGTGRRRRDAG